MWCRSLANDKSRCGSITALEHKYEYSFACSPDNVSSPFVNSVCGKGTKNKSSTENALIYGFLYYSASYAIIKEYMSLFAEKMHESTRIRVVFGSGYQSACLKENLKYSSARM
jgi:hypothetical protein